MFGIKIFQSLFSLDYPLHEYPERVDKVNQRGVRRLSPNQEGNPQCRFSSSEFSKLLLHFEQV
jgi:hypothetical protein